MTADELRQSMAHALPEPEGDDNQTDAPRLPLIAPVLLDGQEDLALSGLA